MQLVDKKFKVRGLQKKQKRRFDLITNPIFLFKRFNKLNKC